MTPETQTPRSHLLRGPLLALLAMVTLFLAIRWLHTARERSFATQNACISNLRILDGAKEQSGIELGIQEGRTPTEEQISKYIPGGFVSLRCRANGVYSINPRPMPPTCNIPGHELP